MIIVIIIFLLFIQISNAKICFDVEYFFIKIAEVCIKYEKDKDKLKTYVEASTVGIVKLFKDISYKGYAISDKNFQPKEFYLYQKERQLLVIYRYNFNKNQILSEKIKNSSKTQKIIKINDKNFFDPFTASYLILNELINEKIKIFFEDQIYEVKILKKKVENKKIIKIDPSKIKAEGIIKPTGKWKIIYDNGKLKDIKVRIRIGELVLKVKEWE